MIVLTDNNSTGATSIASWAGGVHARFCPAMVYDCRPPRYELRCSTHIATFLRQCIYLSIKIKMNQKNVCSRVTFDRLHQGVYIFGVYFSEDNVCIEKNKRKLKVLYLLSLLRRSSCGKLTRAKLSSSVIQKLFTKMNMATQSSPGQLVWNKIIFFYTTILIIFIPIRRL